MTEGARSTRWWILYAVIAVVAFGSRLAMMLRGGGLDSVGKYDDGVYYAAAAAFVHGRMPYADFFFIQPPGVVLAGAPFAWFGSATTDATGFAVAHVAFMIVGSVNAVLVAVILRRFGFVAAAVGGLGYAISFVTVFTERSILLEPFGTLGILVALLVLSRPAWRARTPWLLAAGAALGMAAGFKIWYVVPALIIIAWSRRGWWRMLLGAIIGGCLIYLPFFLRDPGAAVQQIILDQLGRADASLPPLQRLGLILGDFTIPPSLAHHGLTPLRLTAVLAVIALAATILAATVRGARLYVVLLIANLTILLTAPSFFLHYTALTSPMLALVFGVAVGRFVELVPIRGVGVAAAVAMMAVVAALNVPIVWAGYGDKIPMAALTAKAHQVKGCVLSDDPTILAATSMLTRNLEQGCPLIVDITGLTYGPDREVKADGTVVPRWLNERYQAHLVRYFTSEPAVILGRPGTALSKKSYLEITKGTILHHQPGIVRATPDGVKLHAEIVLVKMP
ncbi:hypothetical protein LK09_02145 [Microbacterium mangrovi]|uniref:Glycosyltransferase RgtA/B/C/D-like domain-containing protein n=1 Tax=Microbacterium mangrovi TaxID=1348253 RepID=A0A0B2A8N7_9MICO|nr:hypothetical protein [Microbacterium mangrovi]KHK99470.1 hypothetical protein LK09_02145 [Microbacterium mangrovi]